MKFERTHGLWGSSPRNWIDSNLPRCPFCKTPSLWELGGEMKFTSYSRYHFRCPNCMAIISASAPRVSKEVFGLHSLLANKNLKIESIGNNSSLQHLVGSEYPLEVLQEWARQSHDISERP